MELKASLAHQYIQTESVCSKRVGVYKGSVDKVNNLEEIGSVKPSVTNQAQYSFINNRSHYDVTQRYFEVEDELNKEPTIQKKLLSIEGRDQKQVIMAKIYQKSLDLRNGKQIKQTNQAFILEEMTKHIFDVNQQNGGEIPLLIKGDNLADFKTGEQVITMRNLDKVLDLLLMLSGSATPYDHNNSSEEIQLSQFSKEFLQKNLRMHQDTADMGFDAGITGLVKVIQPTDLFTVNKNIGLDAPLDPLMKQSQEVGVSPLSTFFTLYTGNSFKNDSFAEKLDDTMEFKQLMAQDVASVNRFNASYMGVKTEQKIRTEQDEIFYNQQSSGQTNTSLMEGNSMQAFGKNPAINPANSPFGLSFAIPPLPSMTEKVLIDPNAKKRGERLVTKTFFSFTKDQDQEPGNGLLSMKEQKTVSQLFRDPNEIDVNLKPITGKRSSKQMQKYQQKIENRAQLLISIFPYVDESMLPNNVKENSAMQNFWEDENLDYKMNNLSFGESSLITQFKVLNFQRQLSQFQNSILCSEQDQPTILTEQELVEKSLLVLQGIPSSGVFELDQSTFTFNLNGNRRVYITSNSDEPVKLAVNQQLLQDMMEAGSYFLHLKEFVNCMLVNCEEVGKILEAFSLAVADFLAYYQAQVIKFQNQVIQRRQFEDIMLFKDTVGMENPPTLLELKLHLLSLMQKLNLLATICFTQKFINNVIEVKKQNMKQQVEEFEEEGFDKFQKMLYGGDEQKFTNENLQIEFTKNLERITNQQWLEEFPRGSDLLSYLWKILNCCESDLQAVNLLRQVFSKSLQPLLQMISEFIYIGSFNDPFSEFFIEEIPKRGGDITYKLRQDESKIPSFIAPSICTAILKVGTHVYLLSHMDKFKFSEKQAGKHQEYFNICNVNTQYAHLQAPIAFVHPTKTLHSSQSTLQLTFNINELKDTMSKRHTQFQNQIMSLHNIEKSLLDDEQGHIGRLIQARQSSIVQHQQLRDKKLKEQRDHLRRIKEGAMKQIQDNISRSRQKKEMEEREAQIEREIQKNAEMEIEMIKKAVADELKRQYLELVQDEMQVLGDVRDADIKLEEKLNMELDKVIKESNEKKELIEKEMKEERDREGQSVPPGYDNFDKMQPVVSKEAHPQKEDVILPIPPKSEYRGKNEVAVDKAAHPWIGERQPGDNMLDLDEIQVDVQPVQVQETVVDEQGVVDQIMEAEPKREPPSRETMFIIRAAFTKPLMDNVWRTIDQNRHQAHQRRVWNLRKQNSQIKNANEQREKRKFNAPQVSIRNKLTGIINQYTSNKEKIQMSTRDEATEEEINVPVHLAFNQCVLSAIKDQHKIVNKCMLHMMYRKLNCLTHLKALKVFYLSGQGDIMDSFVQQLFLDNQESTLKDNSLYFFNNCYEYAVKCSANTCSYWDSQKDRILQQNRQRQTDSLQFGNYLEFAERIQFSYQHGQNPSQMQLLLMNLHNIENTFQLDYKAQYPLTLLLTPSAMQKYNRMFFTLVKVKKVLQLLKDAWKELCTREFKKIDKEYQTDVRGIQILRASMHNFMQTLQEYIMIDAIEAGWQIVKNRMSEIQVFEDLILMHNEFLDRMLDKSMLGRKETKIANFITQIFITIQKFCSLIREYSSDLVKSPEPLAEYQALKTEFSDQTKFFHKFVGQLSQKGHYRELWGRINNV